MMSPCRCVDPSRLHLLLEDDLPEQEKGPLEAHLETCESCRAALEELAGEPRWWEEARRHVPRDLAPSPSLHTTGDHGPVVASDEDGDAPAPRTGPRVLGDLWLDFLAPSEDPKTLGRLGEYEVVDVLGRGGMGVVLKAFDPTLSRMVALKVLSPALAASGAARHRFAREARAAAAVVHEHVVAIHAVSSWRGLPYLVMQYISGHSLQERIDRDGPLEVDEVLRIGMQAAVGLAAAHAHGLVHRDVKPSNILLENGVERVKLTDFGMARAADDASLTQSGVLAGTPQYMAPEQALGDGMDHRADLFSLGSVLYAMCAGRPPFRAETTMAVIRRVCDDRPRPLREVNPDVPSWLAAIIAKLHAKDPARRFQSATEVAEVLGAHLVRLRQPDESPSKAARSAGPVRSRKWAVAAGLLFVLAAIGVAEAGGLSAISAFVATVFRIRTAEGSLVVQIDDPEVKVRVDGEELVIAGTGPQEFRYRPGQHQFVATRDGVPVVEKVVTIHRGGKEIVAISREGATATARLETGVPRGGVIPGMDYPSASLPKPVPDLVTRQPEQPRDAAGEAPQADVLSRLASDHRNPGFSSAGSRPQDDVLSRLASDQTRIRRLEEQLAGLRSAEAGAAPPMAPAGANVPLPGQTGMGPPRGGGPAQARPPAESRPPSMPGLGRVPGMPGPAGAGLPPLELDRFAPSSPRPAGAANTGPSVCTELPQALTGAPAAGTPALAPAPPIAVIGRQPTAAINRDLGTPANSTVLNIDHILTPLPMNDESPAWEWPLPSRRKVGISRCPVTTGRSRSAR